MTFSTLVNNFIGLIRSLVPLIFGVAVVIFLYGLLGYMTNIDDENKRKESIRFMLSGIIGLFLMLSIWGIIYIFANTFGFSFGIPKIL